MVCEIHPNGEQISVCGECEMVISETLLRFQTENAELRRELEALIQIHEETLVQRDALETALLGFVNFQPESDPDWPRRAMYGKEGYEKGDEQAQFWTETYLYNLLGKDDARTLLVLYKKAQAALAGIFMQTVDP